MLAAVLGKHRPLDDAFDAHPSLMRLEPRDRAFARHLLAVVLRRLGQIDDLIAGALSRPLPASAAPARDVLRLGLAQLLFLDTPAHAAVDTAMDLVKSRAPEKFHGLVNAVLRRMSREGKRRLGRQDAARLNTPPWLWDSWCAAYGEATTQAIADAHLIEPPLDFSVKADAELWAEKLEAAVLPTGGLRRAVGGMVGDLPGYAEGAWWVQDAAAALPVRLLGEVRGTRIVDLCAAPGGKTAQLAAAGAIVTAVDRSKDRLGLVKANLDRLGLAAELVVADGTEWRPAGLVDAVLLDAPCSATGTIRRHPDVMRLRRPEDVTKMADLQARLLRAAMGMVKPGGVVVYAVCSLQPEEGEAQIAGLTRRPLAPAELSGQDQFITAAGDLRTLPCHWPDLGGLDGFFAARLVNA